MDSNRGVAMKPKAGRSGDDELVWKIFKLVKEAFDTHTSEGTIDLRSLLKLNNLRERTWQQIEKIYKRGTIL